MFLAEEVKEHRGVHFATSLMGAFWKLHSCQPVNPYLAPISYVGKSGLYRDG